MLQQRTFASRPTLSIRWSKPGACRDLDGLAIGASLGMCVSSTRRSTDCRLKRAMSRVTKAGVMWMPRKRPPFVELWRDRHGKVRVYFRKDRGPRLALPDAIGTDAFNAAYQKALLGELAPVRDRVSR